MIRLKTAILLGYALQMGAIIGGANAENAKLLYDFGENIGLAFQLKDDLLDVYGNPETFGKRIGGDILCNKKTYMLISALDKAEGKTKAALQHYISGTDFSEEEKIKAVTGIYNELEVKAICEEKIEYFHRIAIEKLKKVKIDLESKENLFTLANSLMKRET